MGLFQIFKKKNTASQNADKTATPTANEYIDDITFIRDIKHIHAEPWHQYDVLLEARPYGWDFMKDWADYMVTADLENVSQVTAGSLGSEEKSITASYFSNGEQCKRIPELDTEMGLLSIGGMSQTLRSPVKIVWFNQTRVIRLFTLVEDEQLIRKYTETMVRRTFKTENAMKLAKPIPDGQ